MKVRFIIAMAIGAFISMIFPSAWAGWELPGMIAALLTGPNSSNILVLVIVWAVNAWLPLQSSSPSHRKPRIGAAYELVTDDSASRRL